MPLVEPLICAANNYANPQLLSDAYLGGCDVGECHAMLIKDNYVVSLTGKWRTRKIFDNFKLLAPVAAWLVVRKAEVQVLKQ